MPDSSKYSKSSQSPDPESAPWWMRLAQSIPVIRGVSVSRMRLVVLIVFFTSLTVATTQMLFPNWCWRQLVRVIPARLLVDIGPFWRPVTLHKSLDLPRFNREIYATRVMPNGTVWIGGEAGFLAYSRDRGDHWECFAFNASTGGFDSAQACGGADTRSASAIASSWPFHLPAVQAAQSSQLNSPAQVANPKGISPQAQASPYPAITIPPTADAPLLLDTRHDFHLVTVNTSQTYDLPVRAGSRSAGVIYEINAFFDPGETGFRVLGSNQCRIAGTSVCHLTIEFLPLKPVPYQAVLTLKTSEYNSTTTSQTPSNFRTYTISLLGTGTPANSATTTTPASSTAAPKNNAPPVYTAGDILYIDGTHLVMANGTETQLLVREQRSSLYAADWVRPGNATITLADGTDFSGIADKRADANLYLAAQRSCPTVAPRRSFLVMLREVLANMPSLMDSCGSIKVDPGTHLNAFTSAQGYHGSEGSPIYTDYAVGGRPGQGIVYRIDSDLVGQHTYIPLTHDAAADGMLLPIKIVLPPLWMLLVVLLCISLMWLSSIAPVKPTGEAGIEGMAVNDRPLESRDSDAVRLRTVADGMSRFFRNPSTRAPLVLCINGSWGSGKSSLMNLLADDLRNHHHTVIPFNAWHHQSEEQILASLLQSVRTNALRSPWTVTGAWTRLHIFIKRWPERWFVSIIFCLSTVWTGMLALGFLETGSVDISKLAAFIPALVTTFVTLRTIAQGFSGFLSNPASLLAANGKGSKNELEEQTTLRERFAKDFCTVTDVLGNGKLILLIDDLDRCSPEKIRDVIEAINFLVTAGECYIVLGMARQVVEYYLGQSFSDAIKTMPAALLGLSEEEVKDDGKRESAFANLYLQKMIQLQYNLLPLTDDQAIALLQSDNRHEGATSPTAIDYTRDTRNLLTWETRLRWLQRTIQRWFLPITGTLLLTFGALYTNSLQSSANWVQLKMAPFLTKPDTKPATPTSTDTAASAKPSLSTVNSPAAALQPSSGSATPHSEISPETGTANSPTPGSGAVDLRHLPPLTLTFPVHDNETLSATDVQQIHNGPGAIQILLLVMVLGGGMWLLAQWWLITRPDAENARDSNEFLAALSDWAPALLSIYKTPRGLKQYLNSVRFLAMLQRSQIEPAKGTERQPFVRRIALWLVAGRNDYKKQGILQTLQDKARAGFSQDPPIPDELLVTMAALHATPAITNKTVQWFSASYSFAGSDASVDEKIGKALKTTAERSPKVIGRGMDDLRSSLTTYRKAFVKLNGQTD